MLDLPIDDPWFVCSRIAPLRGLVDRALDGSLLLDQLDDSDTDDYVRTMERLRALPVVAVHGGHEPSFGRARLIEICDDYIARASG